MFHENRLLQAENQTMRTRLKALQDTINSVTVRNAELQSQKAASIWAKAGSDDTDITQMVHQYLMEIEELRARLCESENMSAQLRKAAALASSNRSSPPKGGLGHIGSSFHQGSSVQNLIEEAKRNLEKDKSLLQKNQLKREVNSAVPSTSAEYPEVDEEEESPLSEESDDPEHNSSDSDDEEEEELEENGVYSAELAELTSEISVKQQLIEELELSQRRLDIMKHHYEEKLVQLQERIRNTTEERDKVLAGFHHGGPVNPNSENQVRRIREDYEKKLTDMTSRLKKLQAAQQEHAKLVRSQGESERQLKSLRSDLMDMKRNKVIKKKNSPVLAVKFIGILTISSPANLTPKAGSPVLAVLSGF